MTAILFALGILAVIWITGLVSSHAGQTVTVNTPALPAVSLPSSPAQVTTMGDELTAWAVAWFELAIKALGVVAIVVTLIGWALHRTVIHARLGWKIAMFGVSALLGDGALLWAVTHLLGQGAAAITSSPAAFGGR